MKKRLLSLLIAVCMVLSIVPVFAAEVPNVQAADSDYELRVLTFEDKDYKGDANMVGKKDWSSLIDDPQFFGSLLYPQSGDTLYGWYDKGNTELKHTFTDEWGDHQYWGGGEAISHYVSGDYVTYGGYESQLTVHKKGVTGLATSGGGHNGSDNFAVHFGYIDSTVYSGTKLQCLTFGDGVARVIDHMYVNNIDYALNCYYNGNQYTASIGKDDWVKLVATGHHADGTTAKAEIYLCNGPDNIVTDWTKWDLSSLGAITKLELNVTGSSDNGYGFSQPAYFAYDDVAVRFEKESCLKVLSDATSQATVSAGGLYSLPLSTIFSDSESHSITYGFESSVKNEHTKIANGIFYFSCPNEGTYDVTLTAKCSSGEVSHKLTVTVEKANEGIAAQYNYDETPASSVTVHVTLSNDGYPVVAADGTVMSNLSVTVPYFDLAVYGLEDYYRYATTGGSGNYTGTTVIQRPTGLHLYIYLLERYYMGLAEEKCGLGAASGVLDYAQQVEVSYMDGTKAYDSDGNFALKTSGSATSLYMVNFWGHDENLMYFRNHCYPYMRAGWGATSDYILLSDGDSWDVAMFTNWSFHFGGSFASFDKDSYTAYAGTELQVSTQGWATSSGTTAFSPITGLEVALYDSEWERVETLSYDSDDANTITLTAPKKAGTYYLMALDPNAKDTEEAKIAPATAVLTVEAHDQCVDENGDRICDICKKNLNSLPKLIEGVEDLTVKIQTGHSYQLHDLTQGKIFTDEDDTLTYRNYFYRKSSDGGKTWSELTGFTALEHGGINDSVANSTAGTYIYEFVAYDGYDYSEDKWTLTLITMDVVPADVTFYVGRDQNYATHETYPVLELYKTAGIDENEFDYVGWFTNASGKTEYVYNPHEFTIIDGEKDYVVIEEVRYELHDYEKITFTNSAFDDSDETATASGTVQNNYNMFYASVMTGRYSTRAYGWNEQTQSYDVYLGGQSMELPREKDIYGNGGNDIYLRVVSIYTNSKKLDNTYFAEEDFHVEIIMPITGSMIHSGDAYVVSGKTYYPFMSWASGNGSLYNCYIYPEDTDNYIFSQTINNTTAAGYSVVTKMMSINTAVELKVTVPESGDFDLYFQYNNFNTKRVDPKGETVVNEDGTKTITYKVSKNNGNYTWRLSDPSGKYITKAGWLANVSKETEKTYTFSEQTNHASHDFSNLGTTVALRDEADIQVFLDHDGFASTSDTYRVRAFRMWELINSDTANIMVEPDFNIQVLQGNASDVTLTNGGNAKSNWIDIKPTTTDIVAVTYDAIEMYSSSDTYATHGGIFPATAPERAGVFVITNEAEGTANAVISFNGSKQTDRGSVWDYNYDTWYYCNTDTSPTLDFTVDAADGVVVSYATVTTDSDLNSTLSGWMTLSADDSGTYHADLLKFRNADTAGGTVIIKMTDSSGTSYCLARVAEMEVTLSNASNPGEAFMPGDSVSVSFSGLYRAVNKVAGIFNPLTYYLRYSAGEAEFNGSLGQYQRMDRATITLTIPEDVAFAEGENSTLYTFTNGYIYGSMYSASSPFDTLYNMTDAGVGTNFSAVGVSFVLSRLADIPVTVERKVYYDVKLVPSDENGTIETFTITLTDSEGTQIEAQEDGTFHLGYGVYSYTICSDGYCVERGSFTLGSSSSESVENGLITLKISMKHAGKNAWDGTSVSEPTAIDGVYQIGTGAELAWFAQQVNDGNGAISAVMTADIDLAGYEWTPIGSYNKKFTGNFDGKDHSVKNLYIHNTGGTMYQALFGYIEGKTSAKKTIANLTVSGTVTLESTKSMSTIYAAGVVGSAKYVDITNVHSSVDVSVVRTSGNWARVGGVVGSANACTITNCSNSGSISGYQYVGGVAGYLESASSVFSCFNSGSIAGYQYVGGITGCTSNASVSASYNTGAVSASGKWAGGITGASSGASSVLKNCFNVGAVSGGSVIGSISGNVNNASSVTSALYYLEGTCDNAFGAVTGEHTAQSVGASSIASSEFVEMVNADLDSAAFKCGKEHPVLLWQASSESETLPGDVNGDGSINAQDMSAILGYINGETFTDEQVALADVNGDGAVNMADVALIASYINGEITEFVK